MDVKLSLQTPFQRKSFDLKIVDNWFEIKCNEDTLPPPRYGHTLVLIPNEFLLLCGGRSENGYLNDLYLFDLISNTWKKTKTKIPKRCLHSAILTEDGESIIIFGGHNADIFLNDTILLKTKSLEFTNIQTTGDIPSGRQGKFFTN